MLWLVVIIIDECRRASQIEPTSMSCLVWICSISIVTISGACAGIELHNAACVVAQVMSDASRMCTVQGSSLHTQTTALFAYACPSKPLHGHDVCCAAQEVWRLQISLGRCIPLASMGSPFEAQCHRTCTVSLYLTSWRYLQPKLLVCSLCSKLILLGTITPL